MCVFGCFPIHFIYIYHDVERVSYEYDDEEAYVSMYLYDDLMNQAASNKSICCNKKCFAWISKTATGNNNKKK